MRTGIIVGLLLLVKIIIAQDEQGYQTPPKEIVELVLAKPTPSVSIDRRGEWMLLMEGSPLPSVEEMAQPELRIAGIRINPNTFGPSRGAHFTNFQLKNIRTGKVSDVNGLPKELRASGVQWNVKENKIAFTHTTDEEISLWVIDIATATARRITDDALNAVMGASYQWSGPEAIVYKAVTTQASDLPARPLAPTGPVVQENKGKAAASRTYQDLIRSTYDETLFEFYATAQLKRIELIGEKSKTSIKTGCFWNVVTLARQKIYSCKKHRQALFLLISLEWISAFCQGA